MQPKARVLDRFAPDDVAALRALAVEVEAKSGTNPFGELTWTGLEGRGTLGDRGISRRAPTTGAAAYVHLAHHQPDEWSAERSRSARGTTTLLPQLLSQAIDAVAREGGGHVTLWLHGEQSDERAATRPGSRSSASCSKCASRSRSPEEPRWPDGITVRTFVSDKTKTSGSS